MLDNISENRGIYGYEKSKEKKRMDTILDSSALANGKAIEGFEPAKELSEVGETIDRIEKYNNVLGNKEERSAFYHNASRESLVPKDTDGRRRRNFVLSRNVAEDAVNDFYKQSVRPEFEQQRLRAEDSAKEKYKNAAIVPGANPFLSLGEARKAADPAKVVSTTMERLDNEQLNKLADAYARYGGLDTDSYRDTVLKPNIENRMYNEYVKENTPKSSLEYVASSAYDNSLSGKLTNILVDEYSGTKTQRALENEGMMNYDANRVENFAAGVGSLLIDSGVFAGVGGAASKLTGKATSAISKSLTSRVFAKGAARGLSEEAAQRIVDRTFINNIGTRIATSGTAQGLTLGAYDATNSVADDLLYGDSIDAGKAANSFAKGFGTGMMLGAVGTPLKQKASGLTGGKKIAASAGVLSAESAVFTLGTEIEKAVNDIEIEPIDLLADFGESTATLLAMRMSHWRPKGHREKLDNDGRLKPELSFNHLERQEIRDAGVNPEKFISSIEQELHPRYPSLHGNARRDFIRNYEGLMSTEGLSAGTRAKLLYIVENKLTSTPPIAVDCEVEMSDGRALVNVKDNAGRNVQRLAFESRAKADAFVENNSGLMRRNRIASIEEAFQRSVDSENFFKQAGEYAKETGVSVEEISNAMYKKAKHQSLNNRETQLIDDIMSRTSYNDIELGNVMHNIRRNVEQRYGLHTGALLGAIDKNRADCTVSENKALNDYENIIRNQAERMRSGVTEEMHNEAQELIEKQGFGAYDNEHIRRYEKAYDTSVGVRPLRGNPDIKKSYKSIYPEEYADILKNGFTYPADGEPPVQPRTPRNPTKGYMYSHDTLARMAVDARDIAKRLNANVELIYDPHQLDSSHKEWGYQTMAKGWYDMYNDKVTINLANNKNIEDIEFTMLHEVVGHRGLYRLFGDKYIDFLDEVHDRADAKTAKEFKISKYEDEIDKYDKIDEYLALIAEKSYKTPAERGILERFKNFIGDALYRLGLPKIHDLDENKIAMILSKHRDAIESGTSPEKHRRKVFGSFKSSHADNDAYKSSFDETQPKYRYRFIGEKGYDNLQKAGNEDIDADDLRLAKKFNEFNRRQKDTALDDFRYRFIGKQGLDNLLKSENRDSYIDNYNMANKLHKFEYSPEYIKRETGWEVGADGKWRYEIDDRDIKVEYYPLMRLKNEYPFIYKVYSAVKSKFISKNHPGVKEILENYYIAMNRFLKEKPKLSEVIPDKMFFDAYPEYRDTKVIYKDYLDRPCIYDKKRKTFYINKSMIGDEKLNRHVAAEMQRMIQDYEGFSKAYPMEKVLPDDIYEQAMEPIEKSDIFELTSNDYWKDPKGYFDKKQAYYKKYGFYPKSVPEEDSSREDFMLSLVNDDDAAQSGNIETRNVMERYNYDDDFRRGITAEETEDIPRSKQISPKNIYDVRRFLKGPIDIIREANSNMWNEEFREDWSFLKDYTNGTVN